MCGRYATGTISWAEYREKLDLVQPALNLEPSWNVKPTQKAPVITRDDDTNQMSQMSWGYQFTIKGRKIPGFNARSEDVKWPYKFSVGKRHCLVPAIGFYEWTGPKGDRTPNFIYLKDDPLMMMAGLWEERDVGEETKSCFTILTAGPNEFMEPIHNRMPIILSEDQWEPWLKADTLPDQLKNCASEEMASHVVGKLSGDHQGLIDAA